MHSGSCLCGNVRYEIHGDLSDFGHCHCRSCRKASGTAFGANAGVDRSAFKLLSGAETLREYQSSAEKLRAFCTNCGSPIYAYLTKTPDVLRIRLGSLDTPLTARARAHTFVSDKADWEDIEAFSGLPQFPEWAPRDVLVQKGSHQP
ncbi:MAG: GFA family protein [Deltaproteobacteria bacterium]|nr:GFA family protein [Deltaproteobacteria bacterium]